MPALLTRRRRPALALALAVGLLATGCSGDEQREPQAILDAAAQRLSNAQTVHVDIASSALPSEGNVLVGGQGDAERPDSFSGRLQVRAAGVDAEVEVLSTGGQFYARLPFATELTAIDPTQFGFGDPGALVDPEGGIDQLLREAQGLEAQEAERVGGQVLDTVTGELPGQLVADLLTSADPSQPVQAQFSVERETDELRRVELTGPFYAGDVATTYTVTLTDYDAPVTIPSPPAASPADG